MLPFVARPPGDPAEVLRAAETAATHWRLPAPRLLRTGMNALFTAGEEVVLRIGRPSAAPSSALWLADRLRRHGLRVPEFVRDEAVVIGDLAVFAVPCSATRATANTARSTGPRSARWWRGCTSSTPPS